MQFSRVLALVAGTLLPVLETVRRWHELTDPRMFPFWFDDWIIGGFLLYGFWRTRTGGGRPVLAAAWAFACGMAYGSFFSTLSELATPDPSGLTSATVAVIKGAMLAVAAATLVVTLRGKE